MTVEVFGYPPNGARPHLWLGALFVFAALSMAYFLLGGSNPVGVRYNVFFGIEVGDGLLWAFVFTWLSIGVWLAVCAVRRTVSDDPAVQVEDGVLRLYTHPAKRVVLRRPDIVEVGPITETQKSQATVYGTHGFEIVTAATGLKKLHLVIGQRAVDAPLAEVHAAVCRFVDGEPRTSDER